MKCKCCEQEIRTSYYKYHGDDFCSVHCVKDYLFYEHIREIDSRTFVKPKNWTIEINKHVDSVTFFEERGMG